MEISPEETGFDIRPSRTMLGVLGPELMKEFRGKLTRCVKGVRGP